MLSEKIKQIGGTLALRLTLYYAGIFTLSSVAALLLIYLMTSAHLQESLDEDLRDDVEEFAILLAEGDREPLWDELRGEARFEEPEDFFFRLFSAEGEVILTSDLAPWAGLEDAQTVVDRIDSSAGIFLKTIVPPDHEYGARVVYARLAPTLYLEMGESLEQNADLLELIVEIFARTMILILLLAALSGWFMARRALKGVEEVTHTALRISKGELGRRIPMKSRGTEIERLARTFNYMLDRIHSLITGIQEVTDNIAHDLRSPVTRIRGTAETTLLQGKELKDKPVSAVLK